MVKGISQARECSNAQKPSRRHRSTISIRRGEFRLIPHHAPGAMSAENTQTPLFYSSTRIMRITSMATGSSPPYSPS